MYADKESNHKVQHVLHCRSLHAPLANPIADHTRLELTVNYHVRFQVSFPFRTKVTRGTHKGWFFVPASKLQMSNQVTLRLVLLFARGTLKTAEIVAKQTYGVTQDLWMMRKNVVVDLGKSCSPGICRET